MEKNLLIAPLCKKQRLLVTKITLSKFLQTGHYQTFKNVKTDS